MRPWNSSFDQWNLPAILISSDKTVQENRKGGMTVNKITFDMPLRYSTRTMKENVNR